MFFRTILITGVCLPLLAQATSPKPVTIPTSVSSILKSFEPSAALFASDLNLFLVASDDTTDDDKPMLFGMNEKGIVSSQVMSVQGLKKMADIESLSQDGEGKIYLLSSLSLNKKGKEKIERNLFVQAARTGTKIKATKTVELRALLVEALEESHAFQAVHGTVAEELDVESHFVSGGDLFIGLKNPQPKPGTAWLVRVGSVEGVFEENLNVEIWKEINFAAISGESDLISEILPVGDRFILATTQESGAGRIWLFDPANGKLSLLEEFKDFKPEGLAYRPDLKSILIVFDQGEDRPYFAFGPI